MKVLISACLLGERVRWDGGHCPVQHPALTHWQAQGVLLSFCPECAAGFTVPRKPVELVGGDGRDFWHGRARVLDCEGEDCSKPMAAGARRALVLAREQHVLLAVLKEGSPSCGTGRIHAGFFDGRTRAGRGVTAALLNREGIAVFSEQELDAAWHHWRLHAGK